MNTLEKEEILNRMSTMETVMTETENLEKTTVDNLLYSRGWHFLLNMVY